TSAPDLASASDSGRSNTDNITNDNTPTFTGGPCTFENSVLMEVNTALTSPKGRAICRGGTYTITMPAALPDGTYSFRVFTATGFGRTTSSASLASVVIDTVALPPVITAPTAGFSHDVANPLTISGNGAESTAFIRV